VILIEEGPKVIFGQFGCLKVRYQGGDSGNWKGPVTGHWYPFGPHDPIRFVDRRDFYGDGACAGLQTVKDAEDQTVFVEA
jgi:hypothetical protein